MADKLLQRIIKDAGKNDTKSKSHGKTFMIAYKADIIEAINAGIKITDIRRQFINDGFKVPCYQTMWIYIKSWKIKEPFTPNKKASGLSPPSEAPPKVQGIGITANLPGRGKAGEAAGARSAPRTFEMKTTVADIMAGFKNEKDE